MSEAEGVVVRARREASWKLLRGRETAATAHAFCRPDGRWFVSIDGWEETAYDVLLPVIADDLRHDLHTIVDPADAQEMALWQRLGFTVARREVDLTIPVEPALDELGAARTPPGIVLVAADVVDDGRLRALDDSLRNDVPGCDGWRNDPVEFCEYSFDNRHFDPRTYLVAVDDDRRVFAGLVRVWVAPRRATLGLVGVIASYRRRGLARALLGAALRPLPERGVRRVDASVDETNGPAISLLGRLGAERSSGSVELIRRRR